ncbi:unnamed protein product [Caenorhabditis sp. 36 PRJEB53466]|nr:unnamed protein product [Caenorhabditis sp. 36 PRJEB53466]
MSISFLFFVFLLSGLGEHVSEGGRIARASNGSVGQTKSPLARIIDDLSILARVTNAIALQSVLRHVRLHDVAAELLHVRTDHFATILATNTSFIISTIDELFAKSHNFQNNDPTALKRLESMREVLEVLAVVKRDSKRLLKAGRANAVDFIANVNDEEVMDSYLMCEQYILDPFADYHKIENGEMEVSEYGRAKNFLDIQQRTGSLKYYINNLKEHKKKLRSAVIGYEYAKLEAMDELQGTVKQFVGKERAQFDRFADDVLKLKEYFEATQDVWSQDARKKVDLERLVAALTQIESEQLEEGRRSRKFVPAFEKSDDVARVRGDLRSQWFVEKVSGGKSTKKLRNELKAFFKFGAKVEKLERSWNETYTIFKHFKTNIINTRTGVSRILSVRFNAHNPNPFETFSNAFKTCWSQGSNVHDVRVFTDFEDKFEVIFRMMDTFGKLIKHTSDFMENTDLVSYQKSMDYLAGLVNATQLTEDSVQEMRKQLKHSTEHYYHFFLGSARVRKLRDAQDAYVKAWAAVRAQNFTAEMFDLSALLNGSASLKVIACLNNSRHLDIDEMRRIVDFLIDFSWFSKLDEEGATKMLLDGIGRVGDEMKRLESGRGTGRRHEKRIKKFKNSADLAQTLGRGVSALSELDHVHSARELILNSTHLDEAETWILQATASYTLRQAWVVKPDVIVRNSMEALDALMPKAVEVLRGTQPFVDMRRMFDAARTVVGIEVERKEFRTVAEKLRRAGHVDTAEKFERIAELNLDFAKFETDFTGAAASLSALRANFDELFGLGNRTLKAVKEDVRFLQSLSTPALIGICLAFILLILSASAIGYAFTKGGRKRYRTWYLYYFPDMDEFERRWRYSLFLDRMNAKNALMEAVMDANPPNTLKELKKGAYVHVYNKFGNTPLHVAANLGYWKILEMLIKHGADRDQLNYLNRTAEQTIPDNYRVMYKEKAADYDKVGEIFDKYRNKKFRIMVPEQFPTSSFHIYVEPRTDDQLTIKFMEKFEDISFNEPSPNATHVVVKTSTDGILETDDVALLAWIFNGTIIVNEQWMSDCLTDPKMLASDEKYLVDRVRYKGQVYENAVLPWSRALAKGAMPFLHGVHFVICMETYNNLLFMHNLVKTHGGTVLDEFPVREKYNAGAHPYLHTNLGPIFILHDAKSDLSAYRTDPLFTVLTEPEFIAFMLRRDVQQETKKDPVPILIDDD